MTIQPSDQPDTATAAADDEEDIAVEVVDDDESATQSTSNVEAELEQVRSQYKDAYERLLRATADLDNARKRHRRELEEARNDSKSRVLREILPVVDNLERALQVADSGDASSIVDGVKLVLRTFETTLEKLEVRKVEALGVAFDPNVHEAMSQVETTDVDHGAVASVLQNGYTLGARLIRPALVVVAKAPEDSEDVEFDEDAPVADDSADVGDGIDDAPANE